jgi:hypothetical protein
MYYAVTSVVDAQPTASSQQQKEHCIFAFNEQIIDSSPHPLRPILATILNCTATWIHTKLKKLDLLPRITSIFLFRIAGEAIVFLLFFKK